MSDWKVTVKPDNGWGCGGIIGFILLIVLIGTLVGSCNS